jgi:hypothetical protein
MRAFHSAAGLARLLFLARLVSILAGMRMQTHQAFRDRGGLMLPDKAVSRQGNLVRFFKPNAYRGQGGRSRQVRHLPDGGSRRAAAAVRPDSGAD